MKTNTVILLLSFFTFFGGTLWGQNLTDNNTSLIASYFQNQSGEQTNVGVLNASNTTTNADIVVTQKGNFNESYITSGREQKQEVNQQGDYNNYEFYSYYNSNPSQVNTVQLGNNNSVQVFGQNELTKNLSIIQNTNNKTLIIKNY